MAKKKEDPKKKTAIKKLKRKSASITTLQLKSEHEIAMDFATKAYKKFGKSVKSIVLFGSVAKRTATSGSDIDIVIIIDDVSVNWDQELVAWYRQELESIMKKNPYKKAIHINTIKLSTWWDDLLRGDSVIINIIRYGEAMIDLAGFFEPLKFLLMHGKIRPTPESIYTSLQRAPLHIRNSKAAELSAVEGLYWAMVDSAHAALIAMNVSPPSPEHIAADLKEHLVVPGRLKGRYVDWYRDLLILHKKIAHQEVTDLKGVEIDMWQERAEEFLSVMAKIVNDIVSPK